VAPNARTVDRSAVVMRPICSFERLSISSAPWIRSVPARQNQFRYVASQRYRTTTTGTPIMHHLKNGNSIPSALRMYPNPMMFGGVPIGVASPPIDAEKLVISISPVA
jgi:hypothetical protein